MLCVCSIAQSCPILCGPMDRIHQVSLSTGLTKQEYWSDLPFPPLEDLSDPGIKPASSVSPALAGRFFTTEQTSV